MDEGATAAAGSTESPQKRLNGKTIQTLVSIRAAYLAIGLQDRMLFEGSGLYDMNIIHPSYNMLLAISPNPCSWLGLMAKFFEECIRKLRYGSDADIQFANFKASQLLTVAKHLEDGLDDQDEVGCSMKLEVLCVSVGMDNGDWSAAWTKAYELALKDAAHDFKLDQLGINLHPSQRYLITGSEVPIKKEPEAQLGLN